MDKCREAFERHQADLTDTDYEVLKPHFDNNEQYFGSRYNEGSLYERDWFVWEACWQSRQAEIDEKDKKLKSVEQILIELKESMTNFKEMDLYDKGVRVVTDCIIRDLEKAMRGEHE
ncbi:hypothetical protein [Acinetobacter bereziniae]|uniref:hypothetical protein n=1 Tax=Acinetobacter bereziniae TaxID=106648 RepID=UPI0032B413FB